MSSSYDYLTGNVKPEQALRDNVGKPNKRSRRALGSNNPNHPEFSNSPARTSLNTSSITNLPLSSAQQPNISNLLAPGLSDLSDPNFAYQNSNWKNTKDAYLPPISQSRFAQ